MEQNKVYSIQENRLGMAAYHDMESDGKEIRKNSGKTYGWFLLPAIDAAESGSQWGRFSMQAEYGETTIFILHFIAMEHTEFMRKGVLTSIYDFLADEQVDMEIKRAFLEQAGEKQIVNQQDVLLYELTGRYLYVMLEVQGQEDFCCKDIQLDSVGDTFMYTFPEIYRERNSFFHRYISVFSSVYNDFQQDINQVDKLFDVHHANDDLLKIYAGWFGFDVSGNYFSGERLRRFVENAPVLQRYKGTKWAMEKAVELVLEETPVIVERNLVNEGTPEEEHQNDQLYGDSVYDIAVLINVKMREEEKPQFIYFLEQFKPIRCNMRVIFLDDQGTMGDYTYLGVNASLCDMMPGSLDQDHELNHMIILE